MPKTPANQNPEGLNALWRALHKLEEDLGKLEKIIAKKSIWDKTWSWFWKERNWSIAVLVVIIGAVGTGTYRLTNQLIDSHVRSATDPIQKSVDKINGMPLQNIGQMSEDIATIKGTLNAWAPLITSQVFKKNIALPQKDFEKALPELKAAAQLATKTKTSVSDSDLSAVGRRTLNLVKSGASESDLAWETVNTLLQYRSTLNSLPPSIDVENATLASGILLTFYAVKTKVGGSSPVMSVTGNVPRDQAAVLGKIGENLNKKVDIGNAFVILTGGTIQLDGTQFKNIILIGTQEEYDGGPVILQNVYFLNCTFEINRTANSQHLVAHLIEPSPANYSVPAS
jgi:hypothetical protein